MYMHFKQRFFSWSDSYDIYGENDEVLYTVEGQLSWGHCLKVFDAYGRHVAMLKEQVFTFLPKFDIYIGDEYVGFIKKEFTFLNRPLRWIIKAGRWTATGWSGIIPSATVWAQRLPPYPKIFSVGLMIIQFAFMILKTLCTHSWLCLPLTCKNARESEILEI